MASLIGRVCAAYRLQTAQELGLDSSGLKTPEYLKFSLALQQLSQHMSVVVPQPEQTSQSSASSIERAVGASHGGTRWVCKAAGHGADLDGLRSARTDPTSSGRGLITGECVPICEKELITGAKGVPASLWGFCAGT